MASRRWSIAVDITTEPFHPRSSHKPNGASQIAACELGYSGSSSLAQKKRPEYNTFTAEQASTTRPGGADR